MTDGNENAAAFDAIGVARTLLRSTRSGALGTLEAGTGGPFVSLVTVATDTDGSPLLLLSGLAGHTRNLDRDGRASLLLAASGKGDPLAHPRVTLVGTVGPVPDADLARCRRRFLARHPKAALYADFPDFGFRRLRVEAAHLNGGFARAAILPGADLLVDAATAAALAPAEEGAVAHMNADHGDAVRAYATGLCGAPDGPWRLTGLDPDGLDLALGDRTERIPFDARLLAPGDLRGVLVRMAARARAAQPSAVHPADS